MKNVKIDGTAKIRVERDGKLRTQQTDIDIAFSDMKMDFQHLGGLAKVFQSLVNSAPGVV